MTRAHLAVVALCLVLGTAAHAEENADPRRGAVVLQTENGWEAQLCLDRGPVGVLTVKAFVLLPAVGTDEVVALDDEGTLHALVPYSGRWSGPKVLSDGRWLGGLAHGDLDPSIDGPELYTGGAVGDLWQVIPHPHGVRGASGRR